jgi:hypothetical protein
MTVLLAYSRCKGDEGTKTSKKQPLNTWFWGYGIFCGALFLSFYKPLNIRPASFQGIRDNTSKKPIA